MAKDRSWAAHMAPHEMAWRIAKRHETRKGCLARSGSYPAPFTRIMALYGSAPLHAPRLELTFADRTQKVFWLFNDDNNKMRLYPDPSNSNKWAHRPIKYPKGVTK